MRRFGTGRTVTAAPVLAELVGDKLPSAPSRLSAQALVPLHVLVATGLAALARQDGNDPPAAALAVSAGCRGL
jgi:uncharacterized membrane protein